MHVVQAGIYNPKMGDFSRREETECDKTILDYNDDDSVVVVAHDHLGEVAVSLSCSVSTTI